jgi:hypothetical protein
VSAYWNNAEWVLDRLFNRHPLERTPRLNVVVGADLWETTGYGERTVEAFIHDFAADLYRVLPWAKPVPSP